jgi:hypothetical protein
MRERVEIEREEDKSGLASSGFTNLETAFALIKIYISKRGRCQLQK